MAAHLWPRKRAGTRQRPVPQRLPRDQGSIPLHAALIGRLQSGYLRPTSKDPGCSLASSQAAKAGHAGGKDCCESEGRGWDTEPAGCSLPCHAGRCAGCQGS